jgi:Na+/alanine symporter
MHTLASYSLTIRNYYDNIIVSVHIYLSLILVGIFFTWTVKYSNIYKIKNEVNEDNSI